MLCYAVCLSVSQLDLRHLTALEATTAFLRPTNHSVHDELKAASSMLFQPPVFHRAADQRVEDIFGPCVLLFLCQAQPAAVSDNLIE